MNEDISLVKSAVRFVVDTTALISYFQNVFQQPSQISEKGLLYLDKVINGCEDYLMIIPSVVFIEVFDKWFRGENNSDEEFRAKFLGEVYKPIRINPNIQIRELDLEVLENLLKLDDSIVNLENRDKIILASAIALNSPLITSDRKIKKYYMRNRVIPALIT